MPEVGEATEQISPPELETQGDLSELDVNKINALAQKSYQKIAHEKGADPNTAYYSPWCEKTSEDLHDQLVATGLNVENATYHGWEIPFHDYVRLHKGTKTYIIDPTWQQFLEKPDENLPKVLIADTETLPAVLSKFNIPQTRREIWLGNINQKDASSTSKKD